ncbi:hypothetical protein KKH36_00500 [Patescibacteria group bacterium]|nr:hypothetical protein [Patescibacteria group bacterium]
MKSEKIWILIGIVLLAWFGLSFLDKPIENLEESDVNNDSIVKNQENQGNQESQERDLIGLNNYEKMRGPWKSLDDEKSVIEFSDKYKIDFYDGAAMSEGPIMLYDEYPITRETLESENGKYMLYVSGGEQFFYQIVKLDENNLEMIYLDRGNTLKYTR